MKPVLSIPEIQSAHAILLVNGRYILQLRDNKPTISSPGKWALFGGKIITGETPLQTIKREISEELSIEPADYKYLGYSDHYSSFENTIIRTWFFVADVTQIWSKHELREGKDVKAFSFEQIANLEMFPVMYHTLEFFHKQQGK